MVKDKTNTKTRGHCPDCGGERNATVVAYFKSRWTDPNDVFDGGEEHFVLKCGGGDTIYYRKEHWFSEDTDDHGQVITHVNYWPAPIKRARPEWLDMEMPRADRALHALTKDVYTALDADLPVMAAIGMRTAFDRASEVLNVDPAISFEEKLKAFVSIGRIGTSEQENLRVLTEAGSAAAHRGWRPSPEELDTLMSILESFLYRTFVIDAEARRLKPGIPPKPRRSKTRKKQPESEGG